MIVEQHVDGECSAFLSIVESWPKMQKDERELSKVRKFLTANVGRFVEAPELKALSGHRNWLTILKRLIEQEGMDAILIGADEKAEPVFVMVRGTIPLLSFEFGITKKTSSITAKRADLFCRMCGHQNGDVDPTTPGRLLRLFVKRKMPPSQWIGDDIDNLQSFCNACLEGIHSWGPKRPSASDLKIEIRRADPADQIELLRWLSTQYPTHAEHFSRLAKLRSKKLKSTLDY